MAPLIRRCLRGSVCLVMPFSFIYQHRTPMLTVKNNRIILCRQHFIFLIVVHRHVYFVCVARDRRAHIHWKPLFIYEHFAILIKLEKRNSVGGRSMRQSWIIIIAHNRFTVLFSNWGFRIFLGRIEFVRVVGGHWMNDTFYFGRRNHSLRKSN